MCGISGVHRRDGGRVEPALLRRMADSLVHRGPDDSGYHSGPGIGFGFRRLSIVDLGGGNQPLSSHDSVFVLGNGEIYNHQTLRRELESEGYRFKTNSDMEVVAHGYHRWGERIVERLNGMFALAIWDATDERLVLARDHLGIKPLYYNDAGKVLRFGSELRAIIADPDVERRVDPDAVRLLLHFGYVPAPHTLVAGVNKLRPGHLLASDREGIRVSRYWHPVAQNRARLDFGQAVDNYADLVGQAVSRQLLGDVPIGLLLSGGVDSSYVLDEMATASDDQIRTFSVGFGSSFEYDELAVARQTAEAYGTQHHELQLEFDSFENIYQQTMWHLEEPVLSQSTFAFHLLTAEVRKHVKVVLTGQGADELWAGYDRYMAERYAAPVRWLLGSSAFGSAAGATSRTQRLARAAQSLGHSDPVTRFAAIHQVFAPEDLGSALGVDGSDARAEDVIEYWQEPVSDLGDLDQLLHIDVRMSLADDLLFYGDKLSMANSVEARVPLLDLEVVEFVESLPAEFKLRGRTGKLGHKAAAAKRVHPDVIKRRKLGFATPVDRWFATELVPALERTVLAPDSWCERHLDPGVLKGLVDDHVSGRRNNRRQLTTLLSFEYACQQLFDGANPATAQPVGVST